MKRLITLTGLLISATALGGPGSTGVAVALGPVSVLGTHTNLWFDCDVTINNQTAAPLTVTNLFVRSPGLALKVIDLDGNELKRTYAWPLKAWKWTHAAGTQETFKRLGYGAKPGRDGNVIGISLPDSLKTVRLQIEGTMSGSSYIGGVTSNVVEVKIPR
jgi:hypothetical protein